MDEADHTIQDASRINRRIMGRSIQEDRMVGRISREQRRKQAFRDRLREAPDQNQGQPQEGVL